MCRSTSILVHRPRDPTSLGVSRLHANRWHVAGCLFEGITRNHSKCRANIESLFRAPFVNSIENPKDRSELAFMLAGLIGRFLRLVLGVIRVARLLGCTCTVLLIHDTIFLF